MDETTTLDWLRNKARPALNGATMFQGRISSKMVRKAVKEMEEAGANRRDAGREVVYNTKNVSLTVGGYKGTFNTVKVVFWN